MILLIDPLLYNFYRYHRWMERKASKLFFPDRSFLSDTILSRLPIFPYKDNKTSHEKFIDFLHYSVEDLAERIAICNAIEDNNCRKYKKSLNIFRWDEIYTLDLLPNCRTIRHERRIENYEQWWSMKYHNEKEEIKKSYRKDSTSYKNSYFIVQVLRSNVSKEHGYLWLCIF